MTLSARSREPSNRWRKLLWTGGVAYLAVLLVLSAGVYFLGDAWGPGTLLLFGPRLIFLTPLPFLAASALWLDRRVLLLAAASGGVGLLCLADFRVRVRSPWRSNSPVRLRILTLNADGNALRLAGFEKLLIESKPDVVAIQESSKEGLHALFPTPEWTVVQGARGVMIASRFPVFESRRAEPSDEFHQGIALVAFLDHPATPIRFACVHLPTPRFAIEQLIGSRFRNFKPLSEDLRLRDWASRDVHAFVAEGAGPLIVAGDFNMPRDSRIFRSRWGVLTDAFADAGFGFGYSKFTRWHGVAIDHVLCNRDWHVNACWVGPDVGSDHRPVLCELDLRIDDSMP